MLFHSTLRKELARSFGATLVVLATVVMTMMLIRTLGQASRGAVSPSDVMMVMGYTVLGHLPADVPWAIEYPLQGADLIASVRAEPALLRREDLRLREARAERAHALA